MNGFDPDALKKKVSETPNLEIEVKAQLDSGERILWTGQPIPTRIFVAAFAIYFFAIPWTAFALFWESMAFAPLLAVLAGGEAAAQEGAWIAAIVFPLFGLPFIGIGFWMLAKPWSLRRQALQTVYALTDRRAMIVRAGKRSEVSSYDYEAMDDEVTRREEKDGSGSLFFVTQRNVSNKGGERMIRKGFEYVPSVREVEGRLRRARQDCAARKEVGLMRDGE